MLWLHTARTDFSMFYCTPRLLQSTTMQSQQQLPMGCTLSQEAAGGMGPAP
jgi:hypothetical protein